MSVPHGHKLRASTLRRRLPRRVQHQAAIKTHAKRAEPTIRYGMASKFCPTTSKRALFAARTRYQPQQLHTYTQVPLHACSCGAWGLSRGHCCEYPSCPRQSKSDSHAFQDFRLQALPHLQPRPCSCSICRQTVQQSTYIPGTKLMPPQREPCKCPAGHTSRASAAAAGRQLPTTASPAAPATTGMPATCVAAASAAAVWPTAL